jgi:hypothetical protein
MRESTMVNKEFQTHRVTESGMKKAEAIAQAFDELLNKITPLMTGDPRCAAICKTKLEESCFFAKKGMSTDPENCQ